MPLFLFPLLSCLLSLQERAGNSILLEPPVPSPLFQGWCAGRVQLCKPLQAVSTAAMHSDNGATHTCPYIAAEKKSRCLCNIPGIRGDAAVGKLLLYRAAACLSACLPPLWPVVVSKLNEEVAGQPAPANWQHPFHTAGMLKFGILATCISMA